MAPGKEPDRYLYLNPVLAETNKEINVTSCALQTSFVDDVEESVGDERPNEEELVPDEDEAGNKEEKSRDLGRPNNKKLVAAVHEKRNQISSNKQVLTEVAKAMQNMTDLQVKRMKMNLDAEEKIEERRRKDRLVETERNRKHEFEIAKIYSAAFASIHQTASHNKLLPFHAPQGTMIPMESPTELYSLGLTPPYSSTPQSNSHYDIVNELNDESHPNMVLIKA